MNEINQDYELVLTMSQENEIMRDLYAEQPLQFGSDFEDIGLEGLEETVNLAPFVSPLDTVTQNGPAGTVIKQEEPKVVKYPVTTATGKLPCREPFAGPLQFELDVCDLNTKSCLYSNKLNKLFTTMGSQCPMKFKWVGSKKETLFLRAVPLFLGAQDLLNPVSRCMFHTSTCKSVGEESYARHVVRARHVGAKYETDPDSERLSVVVPLDRPQPGTDSVTVLVEFACKNSCPGGMNRRSTEIIFTLEDSCGSVLGRSSVQFRVCSCPKRDLEKEERDQSKAAARGEKRSSQDAPPHGAKRLMRIVIKDGAAKKGEMVYIPVLQAMAPDVVRNALGLLLTKSEMEGCVLSPQELELKKQYCDLLTRQKKES